MDPIRVFVVDDHPMIRAGLAAMLATERELRWVGEASSGAEAVRSAPALQPQVVLLDVDMPQLDGVATLAAMRPLLPQTRFVMLCCASQMVQLRMALNAGAAGLLLKDADTADLLHTIRAVHGGQLAVPAALKQTLGSDARDGARDGARDSARDGVRVGTRNGSLLGSDLTVRESELLGLMACGLSNLLIAKKLAIAMPTVKFHVTNILTKLQADNRTEAVLVALRNKLVELK